MLSREHRLTSGQLFSRTVRSGRRAGSRTLVLHLSVTEEGTDEPQVGYVVSKAVGPAVTRTLVKRRLRHLTRERLTALPRSGVLVVRALPAAASASYAELGADFDQALTKALTKVGLPRQARP